jgi:hypothetical protein
MRGVTIVTLISRSLVLEQLAVSASYHAARFGNQAECVSPFARTFPCCTNYRAISLEDKAKR